VGEQTTNSRVTTAQFYEKLMENNDRMDDMERRIMKELKPLATLCKQVEINTKEIDMLRKRSNLFDGVITALTAIGTFLGITIKAP